MQTVSDNWKSTHEKALLNESFVEVSFNITDPDASKAATSRDNGASYISDSSLVAGGEHTSPSPYCTLEQNLWCLDGKREAIPESENADNGYVSDVLSDDTCLFSSRLPIITLDFGEVFTNLIPGLTITWSETYAEFADTFEVIAYNGETVVAKKEVTQNRSVKTIALVEMINYDRIEIVVKKWCLPNHRARIEGIGVCLDKVYGKAELFSYSHSQSVDPLSLALPKGEIKFSIDNTNGEYNPYNTTGLTKYLIEKQEVNVRYGLKMDDGSIEWVKGGTFYLSEWYAKQNSLTAEFTARDIFELLSDIYYDDDFVANMDDIQESPRSYYELAYNVLSSANLPVNSDGSPKWLIDEDLRYLSTKNALPQDTRANCLQLIANATRRVMYQDKDGILRIEPFVSKDTDYRIDSFNSYSKPEVVLSKPIKQIDINVYSSYVDYVDGKGYPEYKLREVASLKVGESGDVILLDNPLFCDRSQALAYAMWLSEQLSFKSRMTLDLSWRPDVRLEPLDMVTNSSEHNTSKVLMTDIEYKFNGAFRATGKGKVI